MRFIYFVPVLGIIAVWNDIPHTEDQRPYKPLQGETALNAMMVAFGSTLVTIGLICAIL